VAAAVQQLARMRDRLNLGRNQDILLAVCIIGVLLVLVIPIRTPVLDVLLTLNISVAVVVLIMTIYLQEAVEFAVFPSLLLVLTLFRLSLNVASTRLILRDANAGRVIDAFGGFVTGNNYVVGFVIFCILVIINFVVITRGAGRISEVAARFTLDAMPGKQMGVDADLNAGLITEAEARARRKAIESEADFYGAMDGATKFVRGDAIAGIIITVVNIIGGFIIGVGFLQMEWQDALMTYTRLTIGDGLVSQVPALIIATASGLIVTRTTSESNLGADFGDQLSRYPRALGVGAAMLMIFGLVPGMPTAPFIVVSLLLAMGAVISARVKQAHEELDRETAAAAEAEKHAKPEERTEDYLVIDPLKIELGYGLIAMADPRQGGDLLSRIQIIRQQMASKMGFVVPVIRIVDNMRMRPNEYRVLLREAEIGRYELMPDHFLAMNPGIVEEEIGGFPTAEPAFGLKATWVNRADRDRADKLGYTIVEPSAVLATHLTELLMAHADELLTREDVQNLINHTKEVAPTVVEELLPKVLNLGEIQKVLQGLLRERISIRNLQAILEVLADYGPRTKDVEILTEYSRHALARQITEAYLDEEKILHVVTLAPELEQEILGAIKASEGGEYIPLSPERVDAMAQAAADAVQPLVLAGHDPIVLTSAQVRRYFRRIAERTLPKVVVLSYNEVDPAAKLQSEGQVKG